MTYVIYFPGPFGGYFNRDRNGEPCIAVGDYKRATTYETMTDAEIALMRVKKHKSYKAESRKAARIITVATLSQS